MYFDTSLCGCYSSDPCPGVMCDWNTVLNYGSCTCEPTSSGGGGGGGDGSGGDEFLEMANRRLSSSLKVQYIKNAANLQTIHPNKQVERFKTLSTFTSENHVVVRRLDLVTDQSTSAVTAAINSVTGYS
jgi:hypothetical protein